MPRLFKVDREKNLQKLKLPENKDQKIVPLNLINLDRSGILVFALTAFLGILFGSIKVPIGNNVIFSFGNSGGPLIVGLIIGHFRRIGKINLDISKSHLDLLRNLGLILFLVRYGVDEGAGFIEVNGKYGILLFFLGAAMTTLMCLFSFALAYYVFKIPLFGALACSTGAMTAAPALGSLIATVESDEVASFYAACHPFAVIILVFIPQTLSMIL